MEQLEEDTLNTKRENFVQLAEKNFTMRQKTRPKLKIKQRQRLK
jgi:hypothetical protein